MVEGSRSLACVAAFAVSVLWLGDAHSEAIDSEHLFGFTEGTDIGKAGEKELELSSDGRFGKRNGSYSALSQGIEWKYGVFDWFRIAPGIALVRHDISGVTGLDDRRQANFEGLSFEMKFQLLDRTRGPFGLTAVAKPSWSRIDDTTGEPVRKRAGEMWLTADKELVRNHIFGAINAIYEMASTYSRKTAQWSEDSTFGMSGALAVQIHAGIFVGGEVRYARKYEGLGLDAFAGHAVFAGPTFYAKLSDRLWVSAATNVQLVGRSVDAPGSLDLKNFERVQALLRFGLTF